MGTIVSMESLERRNKGTSYESHMALNRAMSRTHIEGSTAFCRPLPEPRNGRVDEDDLAPRVGHHVCTLAAVWFALLLLRLLALASATSITDLH